MNQESNEILKGGDLLVKCLLDAGVKYLFGIPGGQLLTIQDAIYRWGRDNGIQTVMVRHEQAGVHAADAYARVTGGIGVCFGTVGPGVTDMIPGVGAAWADNIPLLVIGAQLKQKLDGKSALQGGVDQISLMKPLTKAQFQIQVVGEIPEILPKAILLALSGRKGPVYVDIREDALIAEIPPEIKPSMSSPDGTHTIMKTSADPTSIKKAVDLLKKSRKPLIICGYGVISDDACEQVKALTSKCSIPAGTSFSGIGAISFKEPTYIGASLNSDSLLNTAKEADLVMSIGCKWDYSLAFGIPPLWPSKQSMIQIDVDPEEIGKNRPEDVALVGNTDVVLDQLLKEMDTKIGEDKLIEWEKWNNEQQEYKAIQTRKLRKKMDSDKVPILPQRLCNELLEFFPSDSIMIADGGDISVFAEEQFDLHEPHPPRFTIASVGMGHLGAGIPYAIGAQLAFPDKQVGVLVGDGSFLFNIQELETATRLKLPIMVGIANNSAWGMIKSTQKLSFKKRYLDTDFPPEIDYARIAEGFGCHAEVVDKPEDIKPALQRAFDSGKTSVIDFKIDWSVPKGTKLMITLDLV
ncbi:MAG: thiamine pyrophosphate-binding protein [Candidatus Hodarchaeota archaeon]